MINAIIKMNYHSCIHTNKSDKFSVYKKKKRETFLMLLDAERIDFPPRKPKGVGDI